MGQKAWKRLFQESLLTELWFFFGAFNTTLTGCVQCFGGNRNTLASNWIDDPGFADVARFAPSAVNSQPWYVENTDAVLTVNRYRKSGKLGTVPAKSAAYFYRIDSGIYLCFPEICMDHQGISFIRKLFSDNGSDAKVTKVAVYAIKSAK